MYVPSYEVMKLFFVWVRQIVILGFMFFDRPADRAHIRVRTPLL